MTWPADTLRHFWHHFADSAPWLLGGAFVGVALNRWLKTEWVERWMQTGRTPVCVGGKKPIKVLSFLHLLPAVLV